MLTTDLQTIHLIGQLLSDSCETQAECIHLLSHAELCLSSSRFVFITNTYVVDASSVFRLTTVQVRAEPWVVNRTFVFNFLIYLFIYFNPETLHP